MPPIIFLAFANDKVDYTRYLRNLVVEQRQLQTILEQQNAQIIIEANVDLERIFEIFRRYKDQITVFHYGGHADGYQLALENAQGNVQLAHGEGITSFLGNQKNLQLVFLNACATRQLGEKLIEAGVPAVLTTDSTLKDEIAIQLATQFYSNLAHKFNLANAYKDAVRFVLTQIGNNKKELYRKEMLQENPYSLLFNKNYPNTKDWQLFGQGESVSFAAHLNQNINQALIFPLYEVFAQLDDNLLKQKDYKQKDEQRISNFIIETFPYPIGTHLRVLMANTPEMMRPSMQRLQEIGQCYQTAGHFLFLVLVSQLWEMMSQDASFMLEMDAEDLLKSYFSNQVADNQVVDYWQNLIPLIESLTNNNQKPFIESLTALKKDLQNPDSELSKALSALRDLYEHFLYHSAQPMAHLEQKNSDNTENLAILLKKLNFFLHYRFVPVKEIYVHKTRQATTLFLHSIVNLDNRAREFSKDHKIPAPAFSENQSVVLVKTDLDNPLLANLNESNYLSLMPFIFDENAFIPNGVNSKLFIFKGLQNQNPVFHYLDTDQAEDFSRESKAMETVLPLWEKFKKDCGI